MNRKNVGLLFILSVLPFAFASITQDPLSRIVQKLITYQANRPAEKVFLHLDKPYYASGDNIWFKAYLADGRHLQLDSSISKVMYVELLNSRHDLIKRHILYSPEGIAYGDFKILDSLLQGNYLIRAYTNYLKNFGEDFYFTKQISIYDTDPKPTFQGTSADLIDLQFFPEGGNLVAEIGNRVAFKAINSLGKSVEVEGSVVDEQGNVVVNFVSEHKGMGTFKILPRKGRKYTAKLSKPIQANVQFPIVQDNGYVMQVTDAGENFNVSINSTSAKQTSFNLIGQSRGEVFFAARGEVKGAAMAIIPKNKFPTGIAQLTMFDNEGYAQCERLVFVNHDDNTRLTVTSDKLSNGKKQKIDLQVKAVNSKNEPLQGNFSVSVYDETLVPLKNEHEETIAEFFLFTSDLTGKVEDPAYYLRDRLSKTSKHLDLVMMTHGWRRFTWKEVLQEDMGPLEFYAEKGIRLSGTVLRAIGRKPATNAMLKIVDKKANVIYVTTDKQGKFHTEDLMYYDSSRLAIYTDNEKGKQAALKVDFDDFTPSPSSVFEVKSLNEPSPVEYLNQIDHKRQADVDLNSMIDTKLLEELKVTAKREEIHRRPAIYSKPNITVTSKLFKPSDINLFQALQGKIPGVIIRGTPPSITLRGGDYGAPLFLLNGSPIDQEIFGTLNPSDVDYIDVLRGPEASIFGMRGTYGVISVYLKQGENVERPEIGLKRITYPGFYRAREFYTPKYDDPTENLDLPDIRTTLYWNPTVETDDTGNATFSFFASPRASKYRIVVQGMTYDGKPGVATGRLVVQ